MSIRAITAVLFSAVALLASAPSSANVTFEGDRICLNGECKELVVGRTSFKLANILTYTYTGQGGGVTPYGVDQALAWITHNQRLFGPEVFLRVLLENDRWRPCDPNLNGIPENCMFGSEPNDQGFWNYERLMQPGRVQSMTPVGEQVVEWLYWASETTGVGFELVIVGTIKHGRDIRERSDDVSVEQQSHVIRQTLAFMRRMQERYPRANIIANLINEWTAHAQWKLDGPNGVNMLAVRNDRCKNADGHTVLALKCPPGYDPEQWAGGPIVVDGGGANTFDYEVGPEPGKFRMGLVHPERGDGWWTFPTPQQLERLKRDSRGMPYGVSEWMYYCDTPDEARCREWYGGGWTSDFERWRQGAEHMESMLRYVIHHDEKGAASLVDWPRPMTKLEEWALARHGNGDIPPVEPLPPTFTVDYTPLIDFGYNAVLVRPVTNDPEGLRVYQPWFANCLEDETRQCMGPFLDVLARSPEYRNKNMR